MKIKLILSAIGVLSVCFLGLFSPIEVAADGFICQMRVALDNYWVYIRDLDRDGNPMRQRGELFQGVLKPGQSQTLHSIFGKLRYNFRLYNQSRSQGRIAADCKGNTIKLP